MALTREQKQNKIEKLQESIAKQKAMIFVSFSGLKAQDLEELREKLNQVGAKIMIAKKSLADLAFKQEKINFEKQEFDDELAIVFNFEDELTPIKTVYNFSKEKNNLKIISGYVEKERAGVEEMIALAQLPSKQELYAKLVGTIFAPVSNFVNVQRQNIKGLFYAFDAIVEKNS